MQYKGFASLKLILTVRNSSRILLHAYEIPLPLPTLILIMFPATMSLNVAPVEATEAEMHVFVDR